jgi:hypothetical protein
MLVYAVALFEAESAVSYGSGHLLFARGDTRRDSL